MDHVVLTYSLYNLSSKLLAVVTSLEQYKNTLLILGLVVCRCSGSYLFGHHEGFRVHHAGSVTTYMVLRFQQSSMPLRPP